MGTAKTVGVVIILALVLFFVSGFITGNVSVNVNGPSPKDIEKDVDSALSGCARDANQKDMCYSLVVSKGVDFLETGKMLEICGMVTSGETADMCFWTVSEHLYDGGSKDAKLLNSICLKIKSKDTRNSCQEKILLNIIPGISDFESVSQTCSTFQENGKSVCFNTLAQSLADSDIDKAIEACGFLNEDEKKACYNTILLFVSEKVNAYPDKAISLCGDLQSNVDKCYLELGIDLRDKHPDKAVESCRKIEDSFKRGDCYNSAWLSVPEYIRSDPELSIELCVETKTDYMSSCLHSIARHVSKDSKSDAREACNKIDDEGERNWCLEEYG